MVISFEEKDRSMIETMGMTIIEFKNKLYKMGEHIKDGWRILKDCMVKMEEEILKAWNVVVETFLEVVDSVRMVTEVVRDVYHYPTSGRYKLAKIFSKCTSTDISFGWKITRPIKKWLARSYW